MFRDPGGSRKTGSKNLNGEGGWIKNLHAGACTFHALRAGNAHGARIVSPHARPQTLRRRPAGSIRASTGERPLQKQVAAQTPVQIQVQSR